MNLRSRLFRTAWFFPFLALSAASSQAQDAGHALFRSNCAFCHGADGKGGRGPSLLTARLTSAADADIRGIIRNGIPGTSMPAFSGLESDEMDPLVAYLRKLAAGGATATIVHGDAAAGKAVYANNGCAACHRIGQEGGIYGPELTRVGSGRSVEYLRESIVSPSADVPREYEGVAVTTADGKKIKGVRVNEDTFTVQLRLVNGKFATFDKSKARAVDHPTESLMPAYKLPEQDLNNLVVYLEGLRGPVLTGIEAEKAKGIK